MALFSRRKNDDAAVPAEPVVEPVVEADAAPEAPAADVPSVSISMSTFGGLGVSPAAKPQEAPLPEGAVRVSAQDNHNPDGTVKLPFAPDEPPTEWNTVGELRDNAVLRDALARLPEDPSTPELLGVVRQMLQGHLFLRVRGDAREQAEAGEELQLGIIRDGDRNFLLAFSSGRAIQDAVKADNDLETSSFGQPAITVLRHVLGNDFAGIIIDNASAPARVVVPRDLLERAVSEGDDEFRLKTIIAADRTQAPERIIPAAVAAIGASKMWVAIGIAGEQDGEPVRGVAEARTADGHRLLQLFSHPLEVVALGRDEQPAPFELSALVTALTDHGGLDGVLIDPAGPSLRLSRADLEPLINAE